LSLPGKTKGINVVTWDYNMKTKIAAGKTVSFAGFTATCSRGKL
jgi:hypothetical protein